MTTLSNELVKRILSSWGFVLMRNHDGFHPEWVPVHDNKISLLEMLIKLELCTQGRFKFLQIGANDGIQADPISCLVRKYNLKGTLIEPIPDVFNKLKCNYYDISQNLQFRNMAITLTGSCGIMPFYVFNNSDKEQRNTSGYSSTSKERLESVKANEKINADIAEIAVSYESVSYFISNDDVRDLNLLVTDVEGLDIEIVTEFIERGVFPNIIYTEILGQPTEKCFRLIELLSKSGYLIGGSLSDLLAYRSDS